MLQKETCLDGMMGKRIAPSNITIHDDPTLPGQWGSFFYDDEGTKTQDTVIVDKGILRNFMHSRETAAILKARPTGNARAQGIASPPIVRMSNTYIEKGDNSKEEMFEGIKYGFYLRGSKGGQVDPAMGTFQFSAQDGFLIENGKLTKALKNVSLSGKTLETLNSIRKISDKYEPGFPGHCGKSGQSVPVNGNCPHILIAKAFVGGK